MQPRQRPVVLLDRDNEARTLAADTLTAAGYHVLEAASADDVLSMFESWSEIGVLVTDQDVPGCFDGLGLANFVGSRWPRTPIILTSYLPGPNSSGARFLQKPFPPAALTQVVAACFRKISH